MADLTARIKPKKSSTAGEVPQASDLEVAELAVNTADGKLFVKHTDNSIKEISGGGGASFGDVAPATSALATYATRTTFNTQPLTDQWSASATQLIFSPVAGNGFDLGDELGSTNPGAIGISEDGLEYTYYTCTTWENFTSYYRATLTGFDPQAFYDAGDRPIWVDFAPAGDPAEGATLVYEAANIYYKVKKNSIANQGDFSYQKQIAVYLFNFDASDTPSPPSGTSTVWSSYGNQYLFFSTTDKDGQNAETDLYALGPGSPVVISVNGEVVFDGTITDSSNENSNRSTLNFGSSQQWITDLVAGDVVGIKSDSVFALQSADLPVVDGQVLTWVDERGQWEPSGLPSINSLSDVDTAPLVADAAQPYNTYDSNWPTITQGEWGGNGISQVSLYIHRLDANGVEFAPLAANGNSKTVQIRFQTSGTDYGWVTYVVNVSTISGDIKQMDMVSPANHPEPPGNYTSVEVRTLSSAPATDGQVLTWNDANSQWEPATPAAASAASTRALLGIGEYVDDAAAGTGGVASGAMYYNTTSSDYRLKS